MARLDKELKESASIASWLGVENFSRLLRYCHVKGEAQFCGLKGVYHLQWLSLKLTRYFGQTDRNLGAVRTPDPHEIIDLIQEQRQWEPNLTETFTVKYYLRSFLGLHTRIGPGSAPSGAPVTPAPSVGGTSISGLTLPPLAPRWRERSRHPGRERGLQWGPIRGLQIQCTQVKGDPG